MRDCWRKSRQLKPSLLVLTRYLASFGCKAKRTAPIQPTAKSSRNLSQTLIQISAPSQVKDRSSGMYARPQDKSLQTNSAWSRRITRTCTSFAMTGITLARMAPTLPQKVHGPWVLPWARLFWPILYRFQLASVSPGSPAAGAAVKLAAAKMSLNTLIAPVAALMNKSPI